MNRRRFLGLAGGVAAAGLVRRIEAAAKAGAKAGAKARPNVVLIITDDQGYGDVAALGNKMIHTPNMDELWSQSVRLTNFHVDPTCSPTRSALMAGRYSNRTGIWHTIMGRSLMDPREVTIAEAFRANGYATGMFGKWHLGDNYPLRPQDQGFDYVVCHKGGGVGQGPDWWGNDYFDDTYWRNGKPEQFKGYCTDVWFREATRFIERNRNRPFFCYIATNAPHGPLNVSDKYAEPYRRKGVPEAMSRFYGMIENIDENLGRLRRRLEQLHLADDTILVFLTDNGTSHGIGRGKGKNGPGGDSWRGFNAGMRGTKGSEYDGGHRVPLFIYWPAGKLTGGRDADQLCAHIDVQPTLIDLCGLKRPPGPPLDGVSLRPILYGDRKALRDRILFVHSQRIAHPQKWRKTAVMTDRWRLVNGKELYDIRRDPGQRNNVAGEHPDVVRRLSKAYDAWWESLKPTFSRYVRIGLGSDADNPTRLMSHDWLVENQKDSVWNQGQVQHGVAASGPWAVQVVRDGRYRFDLYRWPKHLDRPMDSTHARLKIGSIELQKDISPQDVRARFELDLKAGPAMLQTWLTGKDGKKFGAYFVWVERL
ncbi:MAG: arylsulfatase [Planctomycetes bacterium]|nr:arylsulfatase [Planctomycetota bacterium]